MRKSIIAILMGLILIASCKAADGTEYKVKFGYLTTEDGQKFTFLNESNLVPLLPISMGAYYGIQIQPSHTLDYSIEVKVHMPNGSSINLPKYTGKGVKVIPMGFDADDFEGEYKLEIFINGEKKSSIIFKALSPKSLSKKIGKVSKEKR